MKTIEDFTFPELVDWAGGYILKELFKGKFENAIYLVCQNVVAWSQAQNKPNKKKK